MVDESPKELGAADRLPLRIGQVGTVAWLCLIGGYALYNCRAMSELDPNEVGDFLAGAAAPLAFLWLVVAVFLQKEELSLQRDELRESRQAQQLQAKETGALVQQYAAAVEVARASHSNEIRKQREQILNHLIDTLANRIKLRAGELLIRRLSQGGSLFRVLGYPHPQDDPNETFRKSIAELSAGCDLIKNETVEPVGPKAFKQEIQELHSAAEAILLGALDEGLDVVSERIRMIELKRYSDLLGHVVAWLSQRPD